MKIHARTIIALIFLLSANNAWALIHVEADGSGDYPTIQAALNEAETGDTIVLGDGIYTGYGNRQLEFFRNVTLMSQDGYDHCIIDCQGSAADPRYAFELFEETGGTIFGITVRNAYATTGAAVSTGSGAYIIEECLFQDNHATDRGGVWHGDYGSLVNFRNCIFSHNTAGNYGGTLSGSGASSVTIQGCTIVRSSAPEGGAIYLDSDAEADIDRTIIAFTRSGAAFDGFYYSDVEFTCSNLYYNVGGDWVNGASGLGINGNISEDPLLLDPMKSPIPDMRLASSSPCSELVTECGQLMGAGRRTFTSYAKYGINPDGTGMFYNLYFAFETAPEGSIIIMEDGVYSGYWQTKLFVSHSLTICSRSDHPQDCIIDQSGSPNTLNFTIFNANDLVLLKGLTFTGFYHDSDPLITLRNLEHVRIENCIFDDIVLVNDSFLIESNTDLHVELVDCLFTNIYSEAGLFSSSYLYSEYQVDEITGCEFSSNTCLGNLIQGSRVNLDMDDCTFIDNTANSVIRNNAGDLSFSGEIRGNEIDAGHLIHLIDSGSDFSDCSIINNTSESGMVFLDHSSGYFDNVSFIGNCSDENGGGLSMDYSTGSVVNCRFESNESHRQGGGLSISASNSAEPFNGVVNVRNCEFLWNKSNFDGGALSADAYGSYYYEDDNSFQYLTVNSESNTFFGNWTNSSFGAQIDARQFEGNFSYLSSGFLTLNMEFCLISHGVGCGGIERDADADVQISCSNIYGNGGGDWDESWLVELFQHPGNSSEDPQYCQADDGDLSLRESSPCLPQQHFCNTQVGANGMGCSGVSSVGDELVSPLQTGISANYPNPFNPRTTIYFELASSSKVSVLVYDISGRLVRTLVHGETKDAGAHETVWDGRDDNQEILSAGVYLARLIAGTENSSQKMILIK